MKFYSTNNPKKLVSLSEAVFNSLPADRGLYMPETIPALPPSVLNNLGALSFKDICIEMARPYLQEDFNEIISANIVTEAIKFDAPLVQLEKNIFALELFHGPTCAFKDFGARFMARLMQALKIKENQQHDITIIVATSGDTGSAVASGFYNVPGVQVKILYPSGKVSKLQEQQLTTLGANISAYEVAGSFDDCQAIVKESFLDADLQKKYYLTSANSINIARLIPQSFYYAGAISQLLKQGIDPKSNIAISVPSGNFGNLTAGILAKKAGIPIYKFIASTNANSVVPEFLAGAEYRARPSVQTISNAMDVGSPSNFARLQYLYNNDRAQFLQDMSGAFFNDDATRTEIAECYQATGYVLDPHGAVGLLGLKEFMHKNPEVTQGVFLETAAPAKFLDVIEDTLKIKVSIPPRLQECLTKAKQSIKIKASFAEFKASLM